MTLGGERRRELEGHLHLVRALIDRDQLSVGDALERLSAVVPAEDHDDVADLWRAQTSIAIDVLEPAELSSGGPQAWAREWDSSVGYYWSRQRSYLRNALHRADFEIDSLDLSSDRVLAHLGDPHDANRFNVRGLVVGHVQSGKTANFSALIAKAVDAGYQIVIVLSGLHNTLRRQTQIRLQKDLGHDAGGGVGSPAPEKTWVWMTGDELHQDFNPVGVNAGMLVGNNNVILVVKKNKSRLDRLIGWMRNKVPEAVPVLVIDDEADQASVNTGGNRSGYEPDDPVEQTDLTASDFDGEEATADELDPSAINLRVRQMINLFGRVSYVAYTATPFASVLIDPNAVDRDGGNDLYPRDFILSLPKPPGSAYVGTERLFGRDQLAGDADDVRGLDVIEIVPDMDVELLIPPRRSADPPTIPPSLERALRDYLLASAAWLHRAGEDVPCTMLVHTDMRKALQDDIADQLDEELASLRQAWRYDSDGGLKAELEARWEQSFRPEIAGTDAALDVPFATIEPHLHQLISDQVPVRRLNSNHLDTADFEEEPTLKAVLVGGNKLSRGVTIEGLLVSYYVRLTPYYDTLLQMGRWFGYRGRYVDLTRLYSTQTLVSWFHDLATAEEDLRRQVQLYEKRRMTPLDFAPKIRLHPVMAVTAENKMRDAQEIEQSFDGELVQTLRMPFGRDDAGEILERNLIYTRQMLSSLGPPTVDGPQPGWEDVGIDFVQEFLDNFWVLPQAAISPSSVRDYIQGQNRQHELRRWRLLVCSRPVPDANLGSENLGIDGFETVGLINRSRLAKDPTSLGVITDPGDELFGLSPEDIEAAEAAAANGEYPTRGKAVRSRRSPEEGVLLIYPISGASRPGVNARNRQRLFDEGELSHTVLGYAISFPFSTSPATVPYVQGPRARGR